MANGLSSLIARPQIADIAGGQRQFLADQQRALLFKQQQDEQARQGRARGLAGAALQQGLGGPAGDVAAVDPALGLRVFDALGVAGDARKKQFTEDVRIAAGLAQSNPQAAFESIQRAVNRNEAAGISSPEMQQFLQEFAADPVTGNANLQQLNSILSVQTPVERELRVKERGVELRESEIEQRRLDRQAGNEARREGLQLRREESDLKKLQIQSQRETNQLKKEELQRTIQEGQRNLQFEASNAVDTVQTSIDLIDRLIEGEGLESAAGISSAFPTLPGTQAADFEAQIETLKSQAFLTQVEKMKGLGALSENEGKKLGAAIGALDLSQSDKALRLSLNRIRSTFVIAKGKLQKKFNVEPGLNQQPDAGAQQAPIQVGRFTVEVE